MNRVKLLFNNQFLTGSFVMIVGSNIANVINYIYHPIMARFLGPIQYGDLASLIALLGLIAMVASSIGLVITRLVSANSENSIDEAQTISQSVTRFGLIFVVVFSLISPLIAIFLNISSWWSVLCVGVVFFWYLRISVVRAVLQGELRFKEFVSALIMENGLRLVLGLIVAWLIGGASGALLGFGLGSMLTWLTFRRFAKKGSPRHGESWNRLVKLFKSTVPAFGQSIAITSLYSSDLLLAKHFLDASSAGGYAVLSILARIIFFGTMPITMVSFPHFSASYANKKNISRVFLSSLGLIMLVALLVVVLFVFMPDSVIRLPYGDKYLPFSGSLAIFGIFISVLAVSNLFSNLFLAMGRNRLLIVPVAAAILQIVLISFWHQSISQIVLMSLVTSVGMLVVLIATGGWLILGYQRKL